MPSLYFAISNRNPCSASSFRAETMSVSFSAAIGVRFGHSQTCFKGDTILALPGGGSLFCNDNYPMAVWMMAMRPWMSMHGT